jgi:hypothetical protein
MFIPTSLGAVNLRHVICFRRISETDCVAVLKLGEQLRHALCSHADVAIATGFDIPLIEREDDDDSEET